MAEQIGIRLEVVDFSKEHFEMVKNPKHGFGKNMNPCIDCHAMMMNYAGELLKRAIADAKDQGRKGLVLTCKDRLVHYYAKFGFENEGVSESVHGNVVWNQMRLKF